MFHRACFNSLRSSFSRRLISSNNIFFLSFKTTLFEKCALFHLANIIVWQTSESSVLVHQNDRSTSGFGQVFFLQGKRDLHLKLNEKNNQKTARTFAMSISVLCSATLLFCALFLLPNLFLCPILLIWYFLCCLWSFGRTFLLLILFVFFLISFVLSTCLTSFC